MKLLTPMLLFKRDDEPQQKLRQVTLSRLVLASFAQSLRQQLLIPGIGASFFTR